MHDADGARASVAVDAREFAFVAEFLWHIAATFIAFDPLNKSALRSMLAPSSIKKCVLPEKRELRWFHRPSFAN